MQSTSGPPEYCIRLGKKGQQLLVERTMRPPTNVDFPVQNRGDRMMGRSWRPQTFPKRLPSRVTRQSQRGMKYCPKPANEPVRTLGQVGAAISKNS